MRNELTPLKKKLISVALASDEFKKALEIAKDEIVEGANASKNEATIESVFERVVYSVLRDIGVRFSPEKEDRIDTKRCTSPETVDTPKG